jgi:hypothetical protein
VILLVVSWKKKKLREKNTAWSKTYQPMDKSATEGAVFKRENKLNLL